MITQRSDGASTWIGDRNRSPQVTCRWRRTDLNGVIATCFLRARHDQPCIARHRAVEVFGVWSWLPFTNSIDLW